MATKEVLVLDSAGAPHEWVSCEDAITYRVKELILWELGQKIYTLRGGTNRESGERTEISVHSIVCLRGSTFSSQNFRTPSCERSQLFVRDRMLCAYCGQVFKEAMLTADHVTPRAHGGPWSWTNLVTACRACNGRKDDRTPEQAKMPLLYVPYEPNRNEAFILDNRRILFDQLEFLLHGVPRYSRLHDARLPSVLRAA